MGRLCVTWGAVGCVGGLGMDDLTGGALEALFFVVFDLSETCAGRQFFFTRCQVICFPYARETTRKMIPLLSVIVLSYLYTHIAIELN